ncbi:MAG: hypothetical protein ABI574_12950 [Burkholderiales bacterium]
MNTAHTLSLLTATLLAATMGSAMAADNGAPLTAQQEYQQARQDGTLREGFFQKELRETRPDLYPQADRSHAKTRAEVLAELSVAQRNGELAQLGETSQPSPAQLALAAAAPQKTRDQVKSELVAARQSGELHDGAFDRPLRELRPDLYPAMAATPSSTPGALAQRRSGTQVN